MAWEHSLSTHIWIFAVGRGNAAFVRTGLNQGFIIDMGASDDFDPAEFIKKHFVSKLDSYDKSAIAQAVLSHPHSDHITKCRELAANRPLYPKFLTCPHDKLGAEQGSSDERLNWSRIKNPEGSAELLTAYKSLYASRQLPLQTIEFNAKRAIPNLEYGVYYARPPICETLHESDDNAYGNSTSIMFYLRHGDHSLLFPGDMTPEGMRHILDEEAGVEKRYTVFDSKAVSEHPTWHRESSNQPPLKGLLKIRGLTILVAPHHGLESCYSEDLYSAMRGHKPDIVVISERRHLSDNDGSVDKRYQSAQGAAGLPVTVEGTRETRTSLSTVGGHHILIVLPGSGVPRVWADRNPERLLKHLD